MSNNRRVYNRQYNFRFTEKLALESFVHWYDENNNWLAYLATKEVKEKLK